MEKIEDVWENLLSRDLTRIRNAYGVLEKDEKKKVLIHLRIMSNENGWHPGQKLSAISALAAIEENEVK